MGILGLYGLRQAAFLWVLALDPFHRSEILLGAKAGLRVLQIGCLEVAGVGLYFVVKRLMGLDIEIGFLRNAAGSSATAGTSNVYASRCGWWQVPGMPDTKVPARSGQQPTRMKTRARSRPELRHSARDRGFALSS